MNPQNTKQYSQQIRQLSDRFRSQKDLINFHDQLLVDQEVDIIKLEQSNSDLKDNYRIVKQQRDEMIRGVSENEEVLKDLMDLRARMRRERYSLTKVLSEVEQKSRNCALESEDIKLNIAQYRIRREYLLKQIHSLEYELADFLGQKSELEEHIQAKEKEFDQERQGLRLKLSELELEVENLYTDADFEEELQDKFDDMCQQKQGFYDIQQESMSTNYTCNELDSLTFRAEEEAFMPAGQAYWTCTKEQDMCIQTAFLPVELEYHYLDCKLPKRREVVGERAQACCAII